MLFPPRFLSHIFSMSANVHVLQATQDELKAAYRRLCMLYHPDKHRDPELKVQAEQLFNLVHEAYEGKRSCNHIMYLTPFAAAHEADVDLNMLWYTQF